MSIGQTFWNKYIEGSPGLVFLSVYLNFNVDKHNKRIKNISTK